MEKITDLQETERVKEELEGLHTAKSSVVPVPERKPLFGEVQDEQAVAPSETGSKSKPKEDKPEELEGLHTAKSSVVPVPERKPLFGEVQDEQAVAPLETGSKSKPEKDDQQGDTDNDKEDKPEELEGLHTAKSSVVPVPERKPLFGEVQDEQAVAPLETGSKSKPEKDDQQGDTDNDKEDKPDYKDPLRPPYMPLMNKGKPQPPFAGDGPPHMVPRGEPTLPPRPMGRPMIGGREPPRRPAFAQSPYAAPEGEEWRAPRPSSSRGGFNISAPAPRVTRKFFERKPVEEDARRRYPIVDKVTKIPLWKMASQIRYANKRLVKPMVLPSRKEPVESMFSRFGSRTAALNKKFWPNWETLEEADDPSPIGKFNEDEDSFDSD